MAHNKRRRDVEDEELDRAIALSLASSADDQHQACHWRADQQDADDLSRGIALSLAHAETQKWDCRRCTFTNHADIGRCVSCGADRQAPFSSASSSPMTAVRCGLAGCCQPRRHRDYCCEEHERRALAKPI